MPSQLAVSTLALQSERVRANVMRHADPLQRYVALAALQDRNEHLFFRVLVDNAPESIIVLDADTGRFVDVREVG